jgi:hypothetical protein
VLLQARTFPKAVSSLCRSCAPQHLVSNAVLLTWCHFSGCSVTSIVVGTVQYATCCHMSSKGPPAHLHLPRVVDPQGGEALHPDALTEGLLRVTVQPGRNEGTGSMDKPSLQLYVEQRAMGEMPTV